MVKRRLQVVAVSLVLGSSIVTQSALTQPRRPAAASRITSARLESAETGARDTGSWLAHGRTYSEQRYSPLSTINESNVSQLGLAWYYKLDVDRGTEASPIVVDGVMYTTGAFSIVYALNTRTGKLLWKYDPRVPRDYAARTCCDAGNRGAAVRGVG